MPPSKGTHEHDEWRRKISEANTGRVFSPEVRALWSEQRSGVNNPNYGKKHSNETRKKISDAVKKNRPKDSIKTKVLYSERGKERWANNPERKLAAADRARNRFRSDEERQLISENVILGRNDIWYGGVNHKEQQKNKYCALWNRDLRNRIRECWDHKSVLSGKMKEENDGRLLSCHHVYYQKKACCEWDEDVEGYFCFIDKEKYYIKGDPNKFVALTSAENTMVNFDKLKWIKTFEDIIEKNGGVCFTTKH